MALLILRDKLVAGVHMQIAFTYEIVRPRATFSLSCVLGLLTCFTRCINSQIEVRISIQEIKFIVGLIFILPPDLAILSFFLDLFI